MDIYGPEAAGSTEVVIHLDVENVDEIFNKAAAAGASAV
jgi:uncharacterized glyoxalase superfamily protein PhnB